MNGWFVVCIASSLFVAASAARCSAGVTIDIVAENISVSNRAQVRGNPPNITVTITTAVSWDLKNDNGVLLDGILLLLQVSAGPAITILNCSLGRNEFWVRSSDPDLCSTSPPSDCDVMEGYCVCDIVTCHNVTNCSGRNLTSQLDDGYVSLPANSRGFRFESSFVTAYDFRLVPYVNRSSNYISTRHHPIWPITSCADQLAKDRNISTLEGARLCCDLGVPLFTPRNVTVHGYDVNFAEGSIGVNVTWFAPTSRDLRSMKLVVVTDVASSFNPIETDPRIYDLQDDSFATPCDGGVAYVSYVTGLLPGETYTASVEVLYEPSTGYCSINRLNCQASTTFTTEQSPKGESPSEKWKCFEQPKYFNPEIDACDYGVCDVTANCTSAGTLDANCTCVTGYRGNGRTNSTDDLGEGCTDTDYCSPELDSPCIDSAICEDKMAPMVGATCRCPQGFFGDGLSEGRGCFSLALLVVIVVLCPLLLLVVGIGCCQWKRREMRMRSKVLTWEQFIANKELGAEKNFIHGGDDMDESNIPTFIDKWELDRNSIELGEVLGRGNYGVVYRGKMKAGASLDVKEVAIKTIPDGPNQQKRLRDFIYEIGFMLNLGTHPNVIQVLGCCTGSDPVLLVTEYVTYGDLRHFLLQARDSSADPIFALTNLALLEMARHIAHGMEYLTSIKVIHGDLAARNVLVGEGRLCKVTDFGLANDVYRYGAIMTHKEKNVPFKWVSPERMSQGEVPITTKSDVWSFGNVLYEMVTLGCTPHYDVKDSELLEKLRGGYRMRRPHTCGIEMYSIMAKCWKWKIWARPSFAQLTNLIDAAIKRPTNTPLDGALHYQNLQVDSEFSRL